MNIDYSAGIVPSGNLAAGSPVTVSGGGPNLVGGGPAARISFSGTAGQYVTLSVGANRGFFYGLNVYSLQGSTQTCLKTCGSGGSGGIAAFVFGPLPITGTYLFYLQFQSVFPSTVTAQLSSSTSLTVGGSAATIPLDEGDLSFQAITFSSSAQTVSLHTTPASCLGSWELFNSSGGIQVSASNITSGASSLGSLSSGTHTLAFTAWWTTNIADTSGFWAPNVVSCSVSLTSP